MVIRRGLLVSGALAAFASVVATGVLHAASLPHYDLDSLILMSSDIVEGRLIGSLPPLDPARRGRGAADSVSVEAVYQGAFAPGDRIPLTGLGHYARPKGNSEGTEPLMDGDRVFLFLNKPRASHVTSRKGGSEDPACLEPVWSGIKLIEDGRAVDFVQSPSDFAPYTAINGIVAGTRPTTEEFRELLRTRVEHVRPLEARFQQPISPEDTTWLLNLLRDRRKPRSKTPPDLAYLLQQDGIAERARDRLARMQDPAALDEALQISGFNSYTLSRGFGTPAGLDFLLQRIQENEAPLETRVRYAKVLKEAVRTYYGRVSPPQPAEGVYLTRIANLARDEIANESLCLMLVESIGQLARSQSRKRKPQFPHEWEQVVTALAKLYRQTTSEQIHFQVELALARHLGAEHPRFTAIPGPILSAVTPAEPSPLAAPERPNSKWIGYRFHVLHLGDARSEAAEIIAKHVESGQTYALGRFEWHPSPEGAGGGGRLPDEAPPGRYRVYPRFRDSDGTIISIGNGFDVEL